MFLGSSHPPRPRVLIADDERTIADTLGVILRQDGYDAVPVYSGAEAVERAAEFHPNLIICDVFMSGLNGIQAAVTIKKFLPDCKILLFSGNAGGAHLLAKAQANGYHFHILEKPVHPSDLLAELVQGGEDSRPQAQRAPGTSKVPERPQQKATLELAGGSGPRHL